MDFKTSFATLQDGFTEFFTFLAGKLKNFRNLSLGEQLAYCAAGIGFLMVLVSLVLFIF